MFGNAEEIRAVRRAIGLAEDMGITKLILEGDSINVIWAIHRVDENISSGGDTNQALGLWMLGGQIWN